MSQRKLFIRSNLKKTLAFAAFAAFISGCQSAQESPTKIETTTAPQAADRAAERVATADVPSAPDSSAKARRSELLDKVIDLNKSMQTKEDAGVLPPLESADVNARQTIEAAVKRHKEVLDLRPLRTYEHITAADLAPLETQEAIDHVRALDLSRLELSDRELMPIRNLKLKKLCLAMDRCNNLDFIDNMKTLQVLEVSLIPLTPKAFERLSKLSELTTLDVSRTGLTDQTLNYLASLKKLRQLALEGDHVSYDQLLKFKKQFPHCHFACGFSKIEDSKNMLRFQGTINDGEYATTAKALEEQIKRWHDQKPPDKDSIEKGYGLLAQCLAESGKRKEAEAMFKKGLEITFSCDTEHLSLWSGPPSIYLKYLAQIGKWDEAVRFRRLLEQKALSQRGTVASLNSSWINARGSNYEFMGMELSEARKYDRAADAYTKAATLYQASDEQLLDRAISCELLASDAYRNSGNKIPAINAIKEAQRILPQLKQVDEKLAITKERELDERMKHL
jgi:tetratricopeptide (TPR) repeat protein